MFWWAHFRKTKAGIKLHTLFDLNTQIPVFIYITEANIHDVNAMHIINYERFVYYILTVLMSIILGFIETLHLLLILLLEQKQI